MLVVLLGKNPSPLLVNRSIMFSNLLLHALLEQVLRLESEDREDDRACVDGGEGVARRYEKHVMDAVLVRWVVAAETDDGPEREAVGVKDLVGRVQPHRRVDQLVQLRWELIFQGQVGGTNFIINLDLGLKHVM